MSGGRSYHDVAAAVEAIGMIARGGFVPTPADEVPCRSDGSETLTLVVVGNAGGAMWPAFRRGETDGADPLDRWTRRQLVAIGDRLGAELVHPSDEPFRPFQRWAQRADDVWPSPIGLLIHRRYGLWHAYRGAFLFAERIHDLPEPVGGDPPCAGCDGRPCLSTCPVGAFSDRGYDADACAGHVRSGREPACRVDGCAARRACPVGVDFRYGPDQMSFHMNAFLGGCS